jgi:hypothetical protein
VQKVVYENTWDKFFAELGFKSFDDFFEYPDVELIGKNNKRSVVSFSLGSDSQKKHFFMKRFYRPHFKDMLFTRRSFGRFCSQAKCEWENAGLLLKNGIETYHPICYGEETKYGVESKSFLVTEKLPGRALTEFVKENWHNMPQQKKQKIMTGLATFIRKIHQHNISLPDLYLWHIFITENPDNNDYDFAVIDLHRMSHNIEDERIKIKNLGRLHHSMAGDYFYNTHKQSFIESYAEAGGYNNAAKLITEVTKQSQIVSAKRNPKPY